MLQDLHVLILGLGQSGLAMARWCAQQGAQLTVVDTRAEPPQLAALRQDLPQARFLTGDFGADLIDDASVRVVYRSPGVPPAQLAELLQAAEARGIPVGGELDLFTQALQRLDAEQGYAPQVLAVTGTNGKTTVTALARHLIERAGHSVAVAGNIGASLLDTLGQRLAAEVLPEIWLLELSSFQLEAARDFEPAAAVLLNLSQDHLDWHGDMAAYVAAKAKVFGQQGTMVLNRDDARVEAMRPLVEAPTMRRAKVSSPRRVLSFGADLPRVPGDFGLEDVAGMSWLVRALNVDDAGRRRDDRTAPELHLRHLMPADALRIHGRHNALNALAALALAVAAGCQLAPMLYGLREYRGEPHRLQSVGLLDGVEYFDDSKGTNVGATQAALQGLGAGRRVVLILGGEGKSQDFAPLAEPISRFARAVVLIGRDAPLIRKAIAGTGVPMIDVADMDGAVAAARQQAVSGDAVLLSPACASFDMFDSYVHRGEAFCAAVRELAHAQGIELEVLA